eukprot:TRINITY_DN3699_c0_g1_i8.p1 TRINITY_DN3699_c0_g1~~TRINITY_DN3699_c0_g1_i8.p1  ORF type:complete len:213 (+),score=41.09 TRINITY_DN3699_c0_g1_i8:103-741(+)
MESASGIFYALIARDRETVLVETINAAGNFPQVTRTLLPKLERGVKQSLRYGEYSFFYRDEGRFTFLCLAEAGFPSRAAFVLLEEMRVEFSKLPPQLTEGIDYSLNSKLGNFLRERSVALSGSERSITNAKRELGDVQEIMVQNIDKLLAREERIELLVKKTHSMNIISSNIKRNADQVREAERIKNIKKAGIIALVIAVTFSSPHLTNNRF